MKQYLRFLLVLILVLALSVSTVAVVGDAPVKNNFLVQTGSITRTLKTDDDRVVPIWSLRPIKWVPA